MDGKITQEGIAIWKSAEGNYSPNKPDLEIAMPWRDGDFKASIQHLVETLIEESEIEDDAM